MVNSYKLISISLDTYTRLEKIKTHPRQSFDEVVYKLLDFAALDSDSQSIDALEIPAKEAEGEQTS